MRGEPARERRVIVPLDRRHDRHRFRCGVEALDRYFREQASQDARRHAATVWVAQERGTEAVHGFYTLSMASVQLDRLPDRLRRKLPRYPTVPAVRLGRLAVALEARGMGLGAHLLLDAMARSLASEIAWVAFLVDAKDETARSFYARYGFASLMDDPNHLFVARGTMEPLFARR
ncbi:MAG: GNAT family N-acetyltransferase [Deltaproteobacteria bacterium]|nr:GNAT family N-acetyltransferase [Deltaproteobacteria bacterium]